MIDLFHASDVHLDHLSDDGLKRYLRMVASVTSANSIVLVTGDITTSKHLRRHVQDLKNACGGRMLYVLGNHDRWDASFADAPTVLAADASPDGFCVFMDLVGSVEIDEQTCVVGESGWYDGRNGEQGNPRFIMRDWHVIDEYRGREPRTFSSIVADTRANVLEQKLRAACQRYERIVVLTHVPPYVESCLHLGRPSDTWALPWFSSQAMGDVLDQIAAEHPNVKLEVLCGHTHSPATYRRSDNLHVTTAKAIYGAPTIESWKPVLW